MRLRLSDGNLSSASAKKEAETLSEALTDLRTEGAISNDAYLEAGVIQGGLIVLANMISQDCDQRELIHHLSQLITRADNICSAHPDLAAHLVAA
jgi:hypothetical protein